MRLACQRISCRSSSTKGSDYLHLGAELRVLEASPRELSSISYANLLQLCGKLKALREGRRIQAAIETCGLKNIFLCNHLVTMYSKCGSLEDARREFERMQTRNVFSWTAIISGYVQNGKNSIAVDLFKRMIREKTVVPDKVTLATAINACANLCRLSDGSWIHQLSRGFEHDYLVGNSLVDMYGKCGIVEEAVRAFERIQDRNALCWTSIMAALMKNGKSEEAWFQYSRMKLEGIKPDRITFVTLLNNGDSLGYEQGKLLHSDVVESEVEIEPGIANGFLKMYSRLGRPKEARLVFDDLENKELEDWNLLLAAFAHEGPSGALEVFEWMQLQSVKPNRDTFLVLLDALCSRSCFDEILVSGKMIQEAVEKSGIETDVEVCCALIRMYGSCGSVEDALQVFERTPGRDSHVEPWDVMLATYAQQGQGFKAYKLFRSMLFECKQKPGATTFVATFDGCACLGLKKVAKLVHACFKDDLGLQEEGALACSLINMFIMCDMLIPARKLFNEMYNKPWLPSWNSTMVTALGNTEGFEAQVITLFRRMQVEGSPRPNKLNYISVIRACARMHAWEIGEAVRDCIAEAGLGDEDGLVANALINLYNFCSEPATAEQDNLGHEMIGHQNTKHKMGRRKIKLRGYQNTICKKYGQVRRT